MSSSIQTEPPPQKWRSVFDLPNDFLDSSRLYNHNNQDGSSSFTPLDSLHTLSTAINEEEETEDNKTSSAVPRLSCNTCKVEFESLLDQRAHFSSDFHRFNVKLTMVGKNIIEEEDFDESASDSLFRDNDISSISGSEDESEKVSWPGGDSYKKAGLPDKQKLFINLSNGDLVSFWKCLLISESEIISHDKDKVVTERHSGNLSYLNENELFERLKSLIQEPRDKSKLRIVLLATGGHFAGCVYDGNTVVAHKTFHRYVVRAKAGKKQSSKDASGKAASSAGASLRRYNEIALKKEVQELMSAWKPYFDASSCVFVHAPSDNRQLLYNSENAYFNHTRSAIRHIPFTVRRPTFKEAKRIYNQLTSIMYEVVEKRTDLAVNIDDLELLASKQASDKLEFKEGKLDDSLLSKETAAECHDIENSDSITVTSDPIRTTTLLHEAAKSGNTQQTLELLEQGLDPCIVDERGRTPYMLADDKEVRNTFRRFMALNLDKWDWHAAKVPSPLTKEMEESQAAKQAEKDAKRKAKAKELKRLRKAKEKAQAQATLAENAAMASQNQVTVPGRTAKGQAQSSNGSRLSKEEELKREQEEEREKRAAAAERRMAAAAALNTPKTSASNSEPARSSVNDNGCSCCNASLAGKVPFHRYNYKYCSTSCMHVHREILEDG